jgi:hypothetical protein
LANTGFSGLNEGRSRVEGLRGLGIEDEGSRSWSAEWEKERRCAEGNEEKTENGEERIEQWLRTTAPRNAKKFESCRGGIGEKPI